MQPDRVTGERRPVTALFVDVVGSTSLAERMDPEDWATTMERAMAIMTGTVERYEGWVSSHTGDGFMALFGLPSAHEDDPARAVSSAIEMVGAIDQFGEELRPNGIEFQIRVGINTGEVVVRDTVAGGTTRDSRIYGDTLNVAARMQTEARPGGIMITGETFGRVSGAIESRRVGPVSVKGKAEPVEAYEVLGRTGVLRSVRGIAGLTSPMVGRDAELAQLVATLTPAFVPASAGWPWSWASRGSARAGFSRSCAASRRRTVLAGSRLGRSAMVGTCRCTWRSTWSARSSACPIRSRASPLARPASGWRAGAMISWVQMMPRLGRSSAISCRCRSTGSAPSVWRTWSPGRSSFDTAKRCRASSQARPGTTH